MRCLKQQIPGSEIHFLTKMRFESVTKHNPYIDRFFYLDDNLQEIKQQLKKEQYDYIIDLHKNIRSYLLRWWLNVKTYSYRKASIQKLLLTRLKINLMPKRHIVDRNLDTVLPLDVKNDEKGMDYFIGKDEVVKIESYPLTHRFGFIAIVIGGSYFTKKLPAAKLVELCAQIQHPIMLLGGPEDAVEGEQISASDPLKIFNACGKFSLNQSAYLVSQSKLVISHDTGLQYIACAYGKKVLAIWGGTSPALAVEPYYGRLQQKDIQHGSRYKNFIVPGLSCQPCSNFGSSKCPRGHFKCMNDQDMQSIVLAALKFLWVK